MAEVGTAFLSIVPSAKGFGAALSSGVDPQVESAGKRAGGRMSAGMKAGLIAGAAAVGAAAAKFIGSAIAEAQESAKVSATTEQIIKSTGGAANVTATQVSKLSTALSNKTGIDDEAIQTGANLLLTFKNVANESGKGAKIFDQATAAAVDLSAAGFGSIDNASKMLGKALNDPVKGMSALGRAGVTFTDTQKKQVAEMVKAGDLLGAQKIILGEVRSQVGGVAEAQATGAQKMATAWGNFKEAIGAKLLPVIEAVTGALTPLIEKITSSPAAVTTLAVVLGTVLVVAFAAATVAMIPLIASVWAFTAALLANPITWIIVGIIALIAAIVLIVTHWDLVKAKTAEAWDWIKSKLAGVWDWIKSKSAEVWNSVKDWISKKWDEIKTTVATKGAAVLQWFRDLPGTLLTLFVKANVWLVGVGEDIVNGIIKGIGNGYRWLKAKIVELGGNLIGWAKSILHIGSPSKVMAEQVGRWIPAGIAAGIDKNAGAVRSSMAALTSDLTLNARGSLNVSRSALTDPASARGVDVTQNIYPQPGQSEREIADMAASRLNFALAAG